MVGLLGLLAAVPDHYFGHLRYLSLSAIRCLFENLFSCSNIVCDNHYVCFIQALAEAKKRIEELEKKLLENVPIDTAKEIGAYQEKMVSAKKYLWHL